MEVNKVIFGDRTVIDLTGDTVSADKLLAGATAHTASGEQIEGRISFVEVYSGTQAPSDSLGNNGDIFLLI